jgi:hypothetical protein
LKIWCQKVLKPGNTLWGKLWLTPQTPF